jgi:glutamate 5-kinase
MRVLLTLICYTSIAEKPTNRNAEQAMFSQLLAGSPILDDGAVKALASGRSLLPVGVIAVEGEFERGAAVACRTPDGREIARGLVNYSSSEARRIARQPSSEIEALLGYLDEPELIHRDNLVLL